MGLEYDKIMELRKSNKVYCVSNGKKVKGVLHLIKKTFFDANKFMPDQSSSAMGDYWFDHAIYDLGEARYM